MQLHIGKDQMGQKEIQNVPSGVRKVAGKVNVIAKV